MILSGPQALDQIIAKAKQIIDVNRAQKGRSLWTVEVCQLDDALNTYDQIIAGQAAALSGENEIAPGEFAKHTENGDHLWNHDSNSTEVN